MSVEKKPRISNLFMDSSPSNWSIDILEEITRRLDTRRDIFNMRAVCSAWRCLIPIPPSGFPMKLPFPIVPNEDLHPNLRIRRKGHFLLKESTIYCLEPLTVKYTTRSTKDACKSWCVKVEEADSGKVSLKDPLSGLRIKCLGKVSSKVIYLLDYRVREIGKAYTLEFVEEEDGVCLGKLNEHELRCIGIKKVVVGHYNNGELCVMALHCYGPYGGRMNVGGKLGVWKMGDDKWASVGLICGGYQDIAYHNGMFHASVYTGEIIAFDPSALHLTHDVRSEHNYYYDDYYYYLAVSLGYLFSIEYFKNGGSEPYLKAYKLDEASGDWKLVCGLQNHVIFMGDDSSYSVSVDTFPGLARVGNCILFRDYYLGKFNFPCLGTGLYIFDVDFVCRLVDDSERCGKIFWPPTWLKTKTTKADKKLKNRRW